MADKTAEQAIGERWAERHAEFAELFARIDKVDSDSDDGDSDIAQEELGELPLAVSTYRLVRIDLSTGGPGDWLEVLYDNENDIQRITYHFAPWFDHAELDVTENPTAQRFAEFFNIES